MGWFLDQFRNKQANLSDNAGRGNNQSANVAQESTLRTLDASPAGGIYLGHVIRAGAGSYDVSVRASQVMQVACIVSGDLMSYHLGTSDCFIPVEGSKVLVYIPFTGCPYGVILGSIPVADHGSPLDETGNLVSQMFCQQIDLEPGASYATELAYNQPFADPKFVDMVNSHMGRPLDLFPGNRYWVNEQGMSIGLLNLLVGMRATDKAKIELGVLDDTVRIVSGYYRHINAQGETQIYNDGGFVTQITTGSQYQCERSGFKEYGEELTVANSATKFLDNSTEMKRKLVEPDLAPKSRFHLYTGHLGDVVNLFIGNPDPTQNPETMSADSKDQGLMHTHIDGSGRMIMRSASGISFQRWDRIPIPKRKREPWDPEGDKIEDDPAIFADKKPFELPSDYPYARNMLMRDMMAWYQKLAYQRLHETSTANQRKDYYLPEETDLTTPDDTYDKQGEAREKFQENDLRHNFLNVEPDGSIILRDAWGSEIVMRGGNIIISCAGQLELRPGKSLVGLAGHDFIVKAKNSIDLTATDKDVRIKADRNLHMLAEGRTSGGGILLESKAKSSASTFKDLKGEKVRSSGIILKASDSTVYTEAKTVHTSGSKYIKLETFSQDGKNDGSLLISVGRLISNAERQTVITTNQNTGMAVLKNTALLAGRSAYLVGGRSAGVLKGSKIMVPLMWAPIQQAPYTQIQSKIQDIYDRLQDTPWLKPFDPDVRQDVQFTYRSTAEYGTNRASEIQGATKFLVYQAAWAFMANTGATLLKNVTTEGWTEYEIDGTYPWPGEDAYTGSSAYLKLEQEENIDPATGIPKIRKDLKNNSSSLRETSFNDYEVTQT
jgi:hypothetical protein